MCSLLCAEHRARGPRGDLQRYVPQALFQRACVCVPPFFVCFCRGERCSTPCWFTLDWRGGTLASRWGCFCGFIRPIHGHPSPVVFIFIFNKCFLILNHQALALALHLPSTFTRNFNFTLVCECVCVCMCVSVCVCVHGSSQQDVVCGPAAVPYHLSAPGNELVVPHGLPGDLLEIPRAVPRASRRCGPLYARVSE